MIARKPACKDSAQRPARGAARTVRQGSAVAAGNLTANGPGRLGRFPSDPQQRRSDVRRAGRRRQLDDGRLDRRRVQADGPGSLHVQGLPLAHPRRAHQLRHPRERAQGLRDGGRGRRAGRVRSGSRRGAHRRDAARRLRRVRQHVRSDLRRDAPPRRDVVRDPAREDRERARAGADPQHHLAGRARRADRDGSGDHPQRRARAVPAQRREGRRPQHARDRGGRELRARQLRGQTERLRARRARTTATGSS